MNEAAGAEITGLGMTPAALLGMVDAEVQRRAIIRNFVLGNFQQGIDFGTVVTGGQKSKPVLYKPGAEKICSLLGLHPVFEPDRPTQEMVGNLPGLVVYVCYLVDEDGRKVGEGRGAAELRERSGWTLNNAIKMCEKRAQVDAVLRVAALSELFTQDLEDSGQRVSLEAQTGPYRGSDSWLDVWCE